MADASPVGTDLNDAPAINSVERLLDVLVKSGGLRPGEAERLRLARQSTGETVKTLVLRLGLMSEDELTDRLASAFGANPDDFPLEPGQALPETVLETDYLRDVKILPLARDGDALVLAMADATDFLVSKAVSIKTRCAVRVVPMTEDRFDQAFAAIFEETDGEAEEGDILLGLSEQDVHRLVDLASDAPVVHLVESMLSRAVEQGASDIHLTAGEDGLGVRYRIDGVLRARLRIAADRRQGVISRLKILAGLDIAESRIPQDGRISTRIAGAQVDIRISTVPQVEGEGAVLRLLRRSVNQRRLDELGLRPKVLDPLREIIRSAQGLFLVTGPTGSGKTTTLYAALGEIARPEISISTIEDPVENRLEGIAQIQVNPAARLDFATALRSLLRQDPDVVLVGEIRDGETAEIANRAALTGHLVLSTLHTDGAAATIPRLLDMGVEPYLLGSTLIGAMAQRLLPRLCPDCKELRPVDDSIRTAVSGLVNAKNFTFQAETIAAATGCEACQNTGFSGRLLVSELIPMTTNLRRAIREGLDTVALQRLAAKDGFEPMALEAVRLLEQHEVALEDVIRLVPPAAGFEDESDPIRLQVAGSGR